MDGLTSFLPWLPGYITREMRKCGKPNCRCARGELHGPYYYRRGRTGGHHWRVYIPREDLDEIRAKVDAHRRLQAKLAANRAYCRAIQAETTQMIRNLRRDGFL